jgi:hypothetical protein
MELKRARFRMLQQLDAIDSVDAAVSFQRDLSAEIIAFEARKDDDARRHRHLLRLMGDAFARGLLSTHTLRELAREARRPAPLSGQGVDFEFVLDAAASLADASVVPIVADLTHLIGVGDIVAVGRGFISIIECKNRKLPEGLAVRGRHWRQRERQSEAGTYLAMGYVRDRAGEPRIALDVDEPGCRDAELRDCVERARASRPGTAVAELGERDLLIACWQRGLEPGQSLPQIDQSGWVHPALGGSATATDQPGPFIANPYCLPLAVDARHAVAEGDLILLRFVDLAALAGEREVGGTTIRIDVYRKGGAAHLRAVLDGTTVNLSDRFLQQVLLNYWAASDTGSMILTMMESWLQLSRMPEEERRVLTGFAYSSDESGDPVVVMKLRDLSNLGVKIPYEELERISAGAATGEEPASVEAFIEVEGRQLVLRLPGADPARADDLEGSEPSSQPS